jgi:CRISPR-associated protein Csm3
MNRLLATVTIYGKIQCVTGLHIGGVGTGYEIGGMDNPVIRDPVTSYPYIPGSSLKGKMRSLMEWAEGVVKDGAIHKCSDVDEPVCRIFGAPAEMGRPSGPTRLIVRDAFPDANTRRMMDDLEAKQGLPKVEVKTENNIDRVTSATLSGPRSQERVSVGSSFDFELIYSLYDIEGCNPDVEYLEKVFTALRLLQDSTLGGGGSRGSGQIELRIGEPTINTVDRYKNGTVIPRLTDGTLTPLSDFDVNSFVENVKETVRTEVTRVETANSPAANQ